MIHRKTVFVVGAGASHDLGFPFGAKFRETLSAKLDLNLSPPEEGQRGSIASWYAIHKLAQPREDPTPYFRAAKQISQALPLATSIDNFLHTHQGDHRIVSCGKIAIAEAILEAERQCPMHASDAANMSAMMRELAGSWHAAFCQAMLDDVVKEAATTDIFKNVSVVCFNYDRCLEQFLLNAIQMTLLLGRAASAALLKGLEIFHPYGTAGYLPWQSSERFLEFGGRYEEVLSAVALEIRTFTESVRDEEIRKLRIKIAEADTLAFLGFAFHPQNMDLLCDGLRVTRVNRVFATGYGISRTDCEAISEDLRQRLKGGNGELKIIVDPNLDCKKFFSEFRRSLVANVRNGVA